MSADLSLDETQREPSQTNIAWMIEKWWNYDVVPLHDVTWAGVTTTIHVCRRCLHADAKATTEALDRAIITDENGARHFERYHA